MSESPTHRVKKKKKSKKSKKRKKRELEEQEPEQEHEPDQEQPIKKQKIEVDQKAPDNLLSTINVLKDRFISLIDETHDPLVRVLSLLLFAFITIYFIILHHYYIAIFRIYQRFMSC